jgi:hypothetical protein
MSVSTVRRPDSIDARSGIAGQCKRGHVIKTFIQRLIGAATLDGRAYEDVEADRTATGQAGLVVLLSSLAAGFGSVGASVFDLRGVVVGTFGGTAGWVSRASLTYLIGTRVLPEPQTRANLGELLRTLAFAASPGLLRVVEAIPVLRWPTFLVTALWMLHHGRSRASCARLQEHRTGNRRVRIGMGVVAGGCCSHRRPLRDAGVIARASARFGIGATALLSRHRPCAACGVGVSHLFLSETP